MRIKVLTALDFFERNENHVFFLCRILISLYEIYPITRLTSHEMSKIIADRQHRKKKKKKREKKKKLKKGTRLKPTPISFQNYSLEDQYF